MKIKTVIAGCFAAAALIAASVNSKNFNDILSENIEALSKHAYAKISYDEYSFVYPDPYGGQAIGYSDRKSSGLPVVDPWNMNDPTRYLCDGLYEKGYTIGKCIVITGVEVVYED